MVSEILAKANLFNAGKGVLILVVMEDGLGYSLKESIDSLAKS